MNFTQCLDIVSYYFFGQSYFHEALFNFFVHERSNYVSFRYLGFLNMYVSPTQYLLIQKILLYKSLGLIRFICVLVTTECILEQFSKTSKTRTHLP